MDQDRVSARDCITQALIRLMREKPFDEINVSEICKAAGYNRITYYRNFSSKEDILRSMLDGIALEFQSKMELHRGEHFATSAARMFAIIKKHSGALLLLHQAHMDFAVMETLDKAFHHTIPDGSREDAGYYRAFQSGGYFYVITQWLLSGMKESPKKMGQILADVVENSTIY